MDRQTLATIIQAGGRILSGLMQTYRGTPPPAPSIAEEMEQLSRSTAPAVAEEIKPDRRGSRDRVTTDETIRYQKREIVKELILLESHLLQSCKIDGVACDCCLVEGTRIYGNPSPVAIESPSADVFSHCGRFRPVTETFERYYDGYLTKLKVGYTSFPLLITPEHLALVARNVRERQRDIWRKSGILEDTLQWVPVAELSDRDFMAFPRLLPIHDRDDISLEMCELLGWYISEGSITGNRVTFSLGKAETGNIARVKQLLRSLFGVEPKWYEKPTVIHVCYTNKDRVGLFREFGTGARQKALPSWFLHLPHDKQTAFIQAAIVGDGSREKYQYVYTTTSETLAYQMRLLLFRLGILHSLSSRAIGESYIGGRKITPNGPRYDLNIAGDAARSLGLECGKRTSGNHGWISENYAFLPIIRNESVKYAGMVRNIGVDGDESYVTAHGALHNCTKHPIKLEGLAQETAGMSPDPVFRELSNWVDRISPMTTEEASASGKYDTEYPRLAMEARDFRKHIMSPDIMKEVSDVQEVPAGDDPGAPVSP